MKKALIIVFFALGIVALLSVVKLFFSDKFPNENRGINTVVGLGKVENLFIGSSMFRKGLSSQIIESELGGDFFIISYNGNQPTSILSELKYLKRNAMRVENLYIDMYVFSAMSEPSISDVRLLWECDTKSKIEIYKSIIRQSKNKLYDTYNFFVSSNNFYMFTYPVSNIIIRGRYYKGATTSETSAIGITADVASKLDKGIILKKLKAKIDFRQEQALKDIVKVAGEIANNVTFVDTVKYKLISDSPEYKAAMTLYENLLNSLNCKFIRLENSDIKNDASNFSDLVHLSGKGQRLFTQDLCVEILKSAKKPQ